MPDKGFNQITGRISEIPRRVRALIVYLHPFRIVTGNSLDPWKTSLDEVNRGSWDYVKLHEIAGGIDVGLPSPYHLLVGRDGAVALPPIPELRNDQAVEYFNRCFAALLLGGVFCDAVSLDGLEFGSLIDWKYIRVGTSSSPASNRFHSLIRHQTASPIEAIQLLEPRTVDFSEISRAMKLGLDVFAAVPTLSGEFLLKGVSGIARRDWGAALVNLWIVVEQITSLLWNREVLQALAEETSIAGQRDQLKDTRTWTTANRHELLFQKTIIDHGTLRDLYVARKGRNELVHRGLHPSEVVARSAYSGVLSMLRIALAGREIPLFKMNIDDHSLSDPFKPIKPQVINNAKYWMEIKKLPGELELELEEAQNRQP
jgi:hypothetical protein